MTKRITDLESAAEESSKRNSEKSKTLREELAAEYTDTIEKLTTEKAGLEKRFEDKRRLSKETETTLNKQVIELEKERAVQAEKLSILEVKKVELQDKYKKDFEELNAKLKELKENESSDKMSLHLENERLKTLG
jgi:hypothetical protein